MAQSDWFHFNNRLLGQRRPGASGITSGPVTAPGLSAATSPGQSTYHEAPGLTR